MSTFSNNKIITTINNKIKCEKEQKNFDKININFIL